MRTLAIGMLGFLLVQGSAAAQTTQEQDRILRGFQEQVAELTWQHDCVAVSGLVSGARIFTPPVAIVFRQIITRMLDDQAHVSQMTNSRSELPLERHPVAFESFPATELHEFPALLAKALPALPRPLEYRLIGNDLVLRDTDGDLIVAVLRDAVGIVAIKR